MQKVQRDAALGFCLQVVVLAVMGYAVGLSPAGWIAGLSVSLAATGLLVHALTTANRARFGPADWVTTSRLALVVAIVAIVVDSWFQAVSVSDLVLLSIVAVVLDGVDGKVARATGTTSRFGARFDMETDAFLILTLSAYVAPVLGWWVLAIGVTRYAFVGASWVLPWLAAPTPPRYWAKVVAVIQVVALTVAASGLLSPVIARVVLAGALVLLAESFGHDVLWLWQRRTIRIPAAAVTGR